LVLIREQFQEDTSNDPTSHHRHHLHTQQREAERQAEHLFQSLLHRAFRGEL